MKVDRVNHYLTVGANVAVLMGLIFVGLEVRNSSNAVIAQTYANVSDGFNSINMMVAADPTLARISAIGDIEPDRLSDLEAIRYSFMLRSYFNQYFKLSRLRENGLLSEAEWSIWAREAFQMLTCPGGKLFVEGNASGQDLLAKVQSYAGDGAAYDDRLGRSESKLD